MSRKEAKRKSVWVPKNDELRWERLQDLQSVWEGYMVELLGLGGAGGLGGNALVEGERAKRGRRQWEGNPEGMQTKVAKADFTGCLIKGESL